VDYASHGPQVDEITGELTTLLAVLAPVDAGVAFYSTLTGTRIETSTLDTEYWITNLRRPVRFAGAVRTLLSDGYRVFIEASPHPVLGPGILDCFEEAGVTARVVPTLRRDDGGTRQVLRALGQAFTAGVPVDWDRFFPGGERVVELPTYAFQGERFWPDEAAEGETALELAGGGLVLTSRLSPRAQPWLADHVVSGTVLVPGTAFVEWALRAGARTGCERVADLTLETPLVLPGDDAYDLQVTVGAAGDDGRRSVEIHSRHATGGWARHATGVLAPGTAAPAGFAWPPLCLVSTKSRVTRTSQKFGPPLFSSLRVSNWASDSGLIGGCLYKRGRGHGPG
jgi:acyl transferase domain-containing protein